MTALARQRCAIHPTREAAARCPQCGDSFCRECITEHDDRIICASCLRQLTAAAERTTQARRNWWPLAQLGAGLLSAWVVFYIVGQVLLGLPEEFHDDTLWRARFQQLLQPRGSGDE